MKLFQLLPKKLYDFACNLPGCFAVVSGENGARKDGTVGMKYLGLHRARCGFVATRSRRLIGTTPDPLV